MDDAEIRERLNTAFQASWKYFKTTKRGKRMPQVKYVAKYFFLAGVISTFPLV